MAERRKDLVVAGPFTIPSQIKNIHDDRVNYKVWKFAFDQIGQITFEQTPHVPRLIGPFVGEQLNAPSN